MTYRLSYDHARCRGVDAHGTECPRKAQCARYTSPWGEYQSVVIVDSVVACQRFVSNKSELKIES
jgi:hypothetical protein